MRIVDGETFDLDDGQQVRLAGILAPSPPPFVQDGATWPPDAEARKALTELVLGRPVELAFSHRRFDRWGRLLAHVFVTDRSGREWVQGFMLRHGHARVDAIPDTTACYAELLAHERVGMKADAGLWPHPAYRIRWADAPQRLMRLRNSFQLIEGTVQEVAVTRSRIYVNFGTDWRTDFTVGVRLKTPGFAGTAATSLQKLAGRRVRVRGWLERRNGPYVELHQPLQIEALGDDPLPPAAGVARGTSPPLDQSDGRIPTDADPDGGAPRVAPDKRKRPEPGAPDVLDL